MTPLWNALVRPHFGRRWPGLFAAAACAVAAACGGSAPANSAAGAAGGGRAAMPAMPVEVIELAPKPVEQVGEFVGIVKSRRSTTIQPQSEGFLTNILVKSGDRVTPGTPLFEVDAASQQAAVASLQSMRAAREADATYAKQQADRSKALLDVGAGSRQEYEQAMAQQKAADAQLKVVDDQIRQQQTELGYYHVVAPTAGVVGDIPVRQGDRVTKSTLLTTVDDNAGLELYVSVPVQQAPRLKMGLPVRLIGDTGVPVAVEHVSFIAPSVDDNTQTVLVKTLINGLPGKFRTDEYVRVQVVFESAPGLTVPVVAVTRVNGQFFVFVADNDRGGIVAHQRPVTLGAVTGNEYVVLSGLKAGERLIVSGIQKIGDGSPVAPVAPTPAAATTAAPPAGQASPAAPSTPARGRASSGSAPATSGKGR